MTDPVGITFRATPASPYSSDLDALDRRLHTAGIDHKANKSSAAPSKGAELLTEIVIPLAAFSTLTRSLLPIIATWLNRPRSQTIEVIINNGEDTKEFRLAVNSASPSDLKGILDSLHWLADADDGSKGQTAANTSKLNVSSEADVGSETDSTDE